jgi:serralysin
VGNETLISFLRSLQLFTILAASIDGREEMARARLTSRYNSLESWTGLLFEADGSTAVSAATATSFNYTHGVESDFQGFTVSFTGTGFEYAGDLVTDGTITSIVVRNSVGALVLTIDQLTGLSSDLSQIVSDIFGTDNGESGPGPNGKIAWSHILVGNDTIIGTSGDDRQLQGFMDGNDNFELRAGDDFVFVGAGNDTISGGSGFDILSYDATTYNEGASAFRGISVNLATGTATDSWGDTDRFTGIEGVWGSRFNDNITGSAGNNEFAGLRGRDTINGGGGTDYVTYEDDYWSGGRLGIRADLETSFSNGSVTGFAVDGFGQRDTLISIEDIMGTRYDDQITGSRFDNWLRGGDGADTLAGGGGRDTFQWRSGEEIGDNDVVNGFASTGASADVLQFRTENFNNMTTSLELVNGSAATDAVGTFVFDGGSSTLYWDEDGTGGAAQIKIAVLTGVASLTAGNFDLF